MNKASLISVKIGNLEKTFKHISWDLDLFFLIPNYGKRVGNIFKTTLTWKLTNKNQRV